MTSASPPGPSITATRPALPLGAPTPASAVSFVRYFWEAYNYAYATYDTSLLEAISQPSCRYCASTVADVQRLAKDHTRVEGLHVSFVEATLPEDKITDQALVVTMTDQQPGRAIDSSGKRQELNGLRNAKVSFGLDWGGGRWLVRGADYHEKSGTPWLG